MESVLEAQKNVKENSVEISDFLKDLDSWATDMAKKDKKLIEAKLNSSISDSPNKENRSGPSTSSSNPPQIILKHKPEKNKSSKQRKEKKVKKEVKQSKPSSTPGAPGSQTVPSPPKKEKIRAYEYDKWDKFDADQECSTLDAEATESSSEEDEEEDLEDERMRQEAVAEKERGNSFFKLGNYDMAIEKYTRGMQLNPYCPLLPANRAMALLKKQQYGAAEQDCSLSLSLDPTYIKALQRRASARLGLGRIEGAVHDYEKILELEPNNKPAKLELEKILDKLEQKEESKDEKEKEEKAQVEKLNLKNNMKGMFASVKATERLEPENDFTPSLLLGSGDGERMKPVGELKPIPAPWKEPDPDLLVQPIKKPPHLRSKKPLKRIEIKELSAENENKKTSEPIKPVKLPKRIEIVEVEGDTESTRISEIEEKSANAESSEKSTTGGGSSSEVFRSKSTGLCRRVEKELNETIHGTDDEGTVPPVPKASAQFYRDWRSLKSNQLRLKYILQFSTPSYPAIFKSQMESIAFSEILAVLVQGDLSSAAAAVQVRGFVLLPRISTLAMFLDSTEKESVRSLIKRCGDKLSLEEQTKLKNLFSV